MIHECFFQLVNARERVGNQIPRKENGKPRSKLQLSCIPFANIHNALLIDEYINRVGAIRLMRSAYAFHSFVQKGLEILKRDFANFVRVRVLQYCNTRTQQYTSKLTNTIAITAITTHPLLI